MWGNSPILANYQLSAPAVAWQQQEHHGHFCGIFLIPSVLLGAGAAIIVTPTSRTEFLYACLCGCFVIKWIFFHKPGWRQACKASRWCWSPWHVSGKCPKSYPLTLQMLRKSPWIFFTRKHAFKKPHNELNGSTTDDFHFILIHMNKTNCWQQLGKARKREQGHAHVAGPW